MRECSDVMRGNSRHAQGQAPAGVAKTTTTTLSGNLTNTNEREGGREGGKEEIGMDDFSYFSFYFLCCNDP